MDKQSTSPVPTGLLVLCVVAAAVVLGVVARFSGIPYAQALVFCPGPALSVEERSYPVQEDVVNPRITYYRVRCLLSPGLQKAMPEWGDGPVPEMYANPDYKPKYPRMYP